MQKNGLHAQHSVLPWTSCLPAILLPIVFILLSGVPGNTEDKKASNTHPLAFGKDQALIDLQKVIWEPLTGEGIPPGPEVALLRGESGCRGRRSARPPARQLYVSQP